MWKFIKKHLIPNSMIIIDHLGESFVLNLLISYFEDNSCFKFGGVILMFLDFSSSFNYPIFSVFPLFLLVCFSFFIVQ